MSQVSQIEYLSTRLLGEESRQIRKSGRMAERLLMGIGMVVDEVDMPGVSSTRVMLYGLVSRGRERW